MVKLGFNLLLWTAEVDDAVWPLCEQIKQWGYDGVELPVFDPNEERYQAAGRRLDELGLDRTTVTVCTADDNPISSEARIRQAAAERLKRIVDASHAAGSRLLCGPIHSALGHFTGTGPTADEWKWAQETLAPVTEHAQQAGIVLALEYLNRFECYFLNSAEDTARFVREMDQPNLRMMYDTFHAHIEEKDPIRALQRCADVLAHVHISENDRSTPGSGSVAWDETFAMLRKVNYDGWLMIEAFGLALPELAAATKIWRRMYENEQQLAQDALRFMKTAWQRA